MVETKDERASSLSELDELRRRIDRIEDNGPRAPVLPLTPLIDPTANVLKLVDVSNVRQDDLRNAAKIRRDDLDALERYYLGVLREAESKRLDAERKQEQTRVDSVLQALQTTITTLTTQIVTTAGALATQAKEQNETTTAAIRLLEANQNRGLGITEQQGEGRQSRQWSTGVLVAIGLSAFSGLLTVAGLTTVILIAVFKHP